jgi:1-acyl-sn-glycerol-3-phosphate acyltransferase
MLMFLPPFFRGVIAGCLLVLNTLLMAMPLLVVTLLRFLMPVPVWQNFCIKLGMHIGEMWMTLNSVWMQMTQGMNWSVEGLEGLDRDSWYFALGNHQSVADIFIAQHLLNGRIPMLKFFLKQELIWVPVIGLCWWALDFPFMKRYDARYLKKHPKKRGKDFQSTQKSCQKFKQRPVAIMNYVEGTRLSAEKMQAQKSPYNYLLKPKAGGLGFALSAMGGMIDELLSISIFYPNHSQPSAWDFLCGRVDNICVKIEVKPIPADFLHRNYQSDPEYKRSFQSWLSSHWDDMDNSMAELHQLSKDNSWSQ